MRPIAFLVSLVALAASAGTAVAQDHHHHHGAAGGSDRPSGLTDQQVRELRAGAGAGFAVAAERSGFPGPRHVVEHADALALSPAQLARAEQLVAEMRTAAARLGEELIASERALDALFATRAATPARIEAATARIGSIRAALQATHLRYHLTTLEFLSPEQVRRYVALRSGS